MMKKPISGAIVAAVLAAAPSASATPSTVFWTPATTYSQPAWVPHLTYDTWFSEGGALQIDTGLTVGVLSLSKLQIEVGADLFFPTVTPDGQMGTLDFAQLNGKATLPEGALFGGSPALSVGLSRVGFKRDVSDYDVAHATLGRTTRIGVFGVGLYEGLGSRRLWPELDKGTRYGLMASWISPDVTIAARGLDRVFFMIDLAAGMNWMGGLGAGVGLAFTPAIQLRTGAVVLLDEGHYARAGLPKWLWSVQLDADLDLRKAEK